MKQTTEELENLMKKLLQKVPYAVKWLFFATVIVIFVIGWLCFSVFTMHCAVSLECNANTTGWWSLFITVLGLPVLMVQIIFLQKTILENVQKPNIEMGIWTSEINRSKIMSSTLSKKFSEDLSNLSKYTEITGGRVELKTPICLLIKNTGNQSIRSMKVLITLSKHSSGENVYFSIIHNTDKALEPANKLSPFPKEFIFQRSDATSFLFPDDFEFFSVVFFAKIIKEEVKVAPSSTRSIYSVMNGEVFPGKFELTSGSFGRVDANSVLG